MFRRLIALLTLTLAHCSAEVAPQQDAPVLSGGRGDEPSGGSDDRRTPEDVEEEFEQCSDVRVLRVEATDDGFQVRVLISRELVKEVQAPADRRQKVECPALSR